ncbi:MAG: hypothetical protein ACLVGL_08730 [Waltera sp.]
MRLYYLASSDYQDGDLEIWIDTIREYDTSGQSGENGASDWKLPSAAQDFDKALFRAEDGYWIFENSDGSEQLKLPILSARPVWNGKAAAELTAEETDAYAAAQRQEILTKVGVVYDVSERAAQETYALLGSGRRRNSRPDHASFQNGAGTRMRRIILRWISMLLRSTRPAARCERHRIWGTASMPSALTADRYC